MEIFRVIYNNTKFAHVTFKTDRNAYCALLDCKNRTNSSIDIIQPADVHLQPDNPIDLSTSPFYNLPDDCLLEIFNKCDFHTLATVSTVCKKLSVLLRDQVFVKIMKFNSVAKNESDTMNGLLTVSRLVQSINPTNFHLKVYRNFENSIKWPAISVDMKSSKSEISFEMDFFKSEWLNACETIAKRIKSVHIHRSIYDKSSFVESTMVELFPLSTKLTISSYSLNCKIPDMSKVVNSLPKLEVICVRSGTVDWKHIVSYCQQAKHLQYICFENCCFDSDIEMAQISQVVHAIQNEGHHFPIGLMFDRIQFKPSRYCSHSGRAAYTTEESSYIHIQEVTFNKIKSSTPSNNKSLNFNVISIQALNDDVVKKYVYIQIGSDSFSD